MGPPAGAPPPPLHLDMTRIAGVTHDKHRLLRGKKQPTTNCSRQESNTGNRYCSAPEAVDHFDRVLIPKVTLLPPLSRCLLYHHSELPITQRNNEINSSHAIN